MKYLSEDFLLHTQAARDMYHTYAEGRPILDYHSHLSPQSIAEDQRFETITDLWLSQDHYKWRLMRANGVDERFITGNAAADQKFIKWAAAVSLSIGNPLYDWSHLELKRYFDIADVPLCENTADAIYRRCNEKLSDAAFSAKNLLRLANVKVVCTTDDPTDSLRFHAQLKSQKFEILVVPSFRVDKILAASAPEQFNAYIDSLSAAASTTIVSYDDLIEALDNRHKFFHDAGCRVADLAFTVIPAETASREAVASIFDRMRAGKVASPEEITAYQSEVVREVCRMNHRRAWVQQLHFGVSRNPRTRLLEGVGEDAGGDCIGDGAIGKSLCAFCDNLDKDDRLAKTILYNINPRDNELAASVAESFQDGSCPGKIQLGPAWWFSDNKDGIRAHLSTLCSYGVIGRFVGMTTDSRSLLSFVRHEYFRRILCDFLGSEMEHGEIPDDQKSIGSIVQRICFNNALDYFGFLADSNTAVRRKTHECALVP